MKRYKIQWETGNDIEVDYVDAETLEGAEAIAKSNSDAALKNLEYWSAEEVKPILED